MIYPYVIQLDGHLRENNHDRLRNLTSTDDKISGKIHHL